MSNYKSSYFGDNTYASDKSNPLIQKSSSKHQRPISYKELMTFQKPSRENRRPPSSPPVKNKSLSKLHDFRKKVTEVIEICKGENQSTRNQFGNIVNQQKQIYNLLMDNPSVLNRTFSQQSFPSKSVNIQPTLPNYAFRRPEPISTPNRQKQSLQTPQSQYIMPKYQQFQNYQKNVGWKVPSQHEGQHQEYSNYLNQPITFAGGQVGKGVQKPTPVGLSTNSQVIIQQIQRKASEEIEKLRRQKLELMQRLNQEIKNVNKEKSKNFYLQNLINSYQIQQPFSSPVQSSQNTQQLQEKVIQLENELQRVNQLNYSLQSELSRRGSGIAGVEDILKQGELIRQETLRLLKLKLGNDANQRIQQLEERLAKEISLKEKALAELRDLKQKYPQKSQFQPVQTLGTYDKSTIRVHSPHLDKNPSQYEDMVSQMKRITGF